MVVGVSAGDGSGVTGQAQLVWEGMPTTAHEAEQSDLEAHSSMLHGTGADVFT